MDWFTFLITLHIVGVALGVGGATISDFAFLKFLKNGKITKGEFDLLKIISNVVWSGVFILAFSGFGIFLFLRIVSPESVFIYDPRMLAHLTIFLVILLNGILMHIKVLPLIEKNTESSLASEELCSKLTVAFTAGAISIVSWYTNLFLGSLRGLDFSYGFIMTVYIVILIIAILTSNLLGRHLIKKI